MSKKKKIENKLSTFTSVILGIFADQPFRPKNYKQVCKAMGIKDQAGKDVVYNLLIDLKDKGLLQEVRPYSYVMSNAGMAQFGPKTKYVEGTVEMKSTGKAYVVRDDGEGEDIFIAAQDTYKALHGDRVRVAMFPKRNNSKPEGEIVEVLERKHTEFVGVLTISHGYVFVRPDVEWMQTAKKSSSISWTGPTDRATPSVRLSECSANLARTMWRWKASWRPTTIR